MLRRAESQPHTNWFVADRPIVDVDQDAFSHADVADNLRVMIEGAGSEERLMIGLLGPFGVGKSTVVELLSKTITDERFSVLRVSAERHEAPGMHRALIYALAEQMVQANFNRADVTNVLLRLETTRSTTSADLASTPMIQLAGNITRGIGPFRWLRWVLLVILVALLVASVLLITLRGWDAWSGTVTVVTAALIAAAAIIPSFAAPTLGEWLKQLATPGQTTVETPRVESADEFERTFSDLVKLSRKKKLIIAIDDLDRLAPSEVLLGLNAIRSFQLTCPRESRPVFIVSADEDIIEAAIIRSNPGPAARPARKAESAQAFLDRLFTHRQIMPVHAGGDLIDFANRLLQRADHEGAKRLGERLPDVLQVLIHDRVQDPRHVTRLLNGFFGDYRLADLREHKSGIRSIATGMVTNQPEALARMTVLKLDFPRFHQALFEDDELLRRLENDIAGTATMTPDDRATTGYGSTTEEEIDPDWINLRGFIGGTSALKPVDDLRPFLYLGQDRLDRVLGGREARQIRYWLENQQIRDLRAHLTTNVPAADVV